MENYFRNISMSTTVQETLPSSFKLYLDRGNKSLTGPGILEEHLYFRCVYVMSMWAPSHAGEMMIFAAVGEKGQMNKHSLDFGKFGK